MVVDIFVAATVAWFLWIRNIFWMVIANVRFMTNTRIRRGMRGTVDSCLACTSLWPVDWLRVVEDSILVQVPVPHSR